MATPKTGSISMNDFNVNLKQASGTAQISLNDIRDRTGYSGAAISFGDLRGMYSATITQANWDRSVNPKSSQMADGYGRPGNPYPSGGGSIDNMFIDTDAYFIQAWGPAGTYGNTFIGFDGSANAYVSVDIANGFQGTDVTKVVFGSTVYSGSNLVNAAYNSITVVGRDMEGSGTVTVAVQFD